MYIRWKDLLLVAVLAFVLPSLIFAFAPKGRSAAVMPTTSYVDNKPNSDELENRTLIAVCIDEKVISMPLEEYIVGVVYAEMPASFEEDALKAQAVAARTYALRRKETKIKHSGYDVCVDPSCCQAYRMPDDSSEEVASIAKIRRAVTDTNGEVLLYGGNLIEATYFSCSGGLTEDAVAVWGEEIPYLQSVNSPGEEGSKHYVESVSFTLKEFEERTGVSFTGPSNGWFTDMTRTNGGGVDKVTICGKVFEGKELRNMLALKSTAFSISAIGDSVVISTKGFGHRVGLSQYGADAMAVAGSDYKDILSHYYKNTVLAQYREK